MFAAGIETQQHSTAVAQAPCNNRWQCMKTQLYTGVAGIQQPGKTKGSGKSQSNFSVNSYYFLAVQKGKALRGEHFA